MHLTGLRCAVVVPRLLVFLLASMALAQPPPRAMTGGRVSPSITSDTYDRILDLVFAPKQRAPVLFSVIVRIIPAFRPESEVRMYLFKEGSATAEYMKAERNIYYASNKLLQTAGARSAEDLASNVAINRYVLNVSAERVLEWQESLLKMVGPTLQSLQKESIELYNHRPVMLVLDGDTYDVRYTQGSAEMHFRIFELAPMSALAEWAASVDSSLSKMTQDSVK